MVVDVVGVVVEEMELVVAVFVALFLEVLVVLVMVWVGMLCRSS